MGMLGAVGGAAPELLGALSFLFFFLSLLNPFEEPSERTDEESDEQDDELLSLRLTFPLPINVKERGGVWTISTFSQ